MTTAHILILFGLAAAWVATLLAKPFGKCIACRGHGVLKSKRRRKAWKCPLCKGKKRRQRLGSRTVHRVRRQVAAHWRGGAR